MVLHAPTGAGKTYVFELLIESSWRGRAVYTVPTRALANDKFREWRARGWEVGLVTGDVRHKPDARVIVATLETQRASMLRGEGPDLFVVDEYQLLGDAQRGPAYEVTLATAPASTQLFLMSGSVSNPAEVADWLAGHGRDVQLVSEGRRPVPLEEIFAEALLKDSREPRKGRNFLPALVARALETRMGPILLFAPRRAASEDLARQLAIELPEVDPLELTPSKSGLPAKNWQVCSSVALPTTTADSITFGGQALSNLSPRRASFGPWLLPPDLPQGSISPCVQYSSRPGISYRR